MKISLTVLLILSSLAFSQHATCQNRIDSLQKIKWIEGNWKGMDGSNPFYEVYKFKNDTTLEIYSYDWNGKDSSKTVKSVLTRHNGFYYLGEEKNYKVISIKDSSIIMIPNYKANNAVIWMKEDVDKWKAIIETRDKMKTYLMERVHHFKDR